MRERLGRLWGMQPPAEPGFSYREMAGGGVRGLYVIGADPAAEPAAAESLRKLDFLVVQDMFLTATAQLADVVLPATSFAEGDGTYTNLERRVQRAPAAIKAAGESRPDWEILAALADCWQEAGSAGDGAAVTAAKEAAEPAWKRKRRQARSLKDARQANTPRPWNYPTAATVLDEIGKAVPLYSGIRWDNLGPGGMQWPGSALSRSVRKVEPANAGAPAAPDKGRYWLVSSPVLWDAQPIVMHSHKQVLKRIPEPFVALNPADLALAGLPEDARVSVTSSRGRVSLAIRADAAVQPGTAWVPLGLSGMPAEALGGGRGEAIAVQIRKD